MVAEKTMLMNAISGMYKPSSGRVVFAENDR